VAESPSSHPIGHRSLARWHTALAGPAALQIPMADLLPTPLAATAPGWNIATLEDRLLQATIPQTGTGYTYSKVSAPLNGTLSISATGAIEYMPKADYYGFDSFQYKVTDAAGVSTVYSAYVDVYAVDDAPVAVAQTATGPEETVITGMLAASDIDSNSFSLRVAVPPRNGQVSITGSGSFTYVPLPNFSGTDVFSYVANDGTSDSRPATVTITVTQVNDPPVLALPINDRTVTARSPFTMSFSSGVFYDIDGSALTLTATKADGSALPSWLAFDPVKRTFSGTPRNLDVGTMPIKLTASDGEFSVTDTFDLIIKQGPNGAPVSSHGSATVQEDMAFQGTLPSAVDDEGDAFTYVKAAGPAHGTLEFNANGQFSYRPDADYFGPDSFSFRLSDGKLESQLYTMSLTVQDVADRVDGTELDDTFPSRAGADIYTLKGGNDRVAAGPGDDQIDGGAGIDTSVYGGPRSRYVLTSEDNGQWSVDDSNTVGDEGRDTLAALERVSFADLQVALDTSASGNAGKAAQVMRALAGPDALDKPMWMGIAIDLFDDGLSYQAVVKVAIDIDLVGALAGSTTNAAFVQWVYHNVMGEDPSAQDAQYFTQLLTSGQATKLDLALLAAQSPVNVGSAELVGLATTGLVYEPFAG
jgi:hypothetical protein